MRLFGRRGRQRTESSTITGPSDAELEERGWDAITKAVTRHFSGQEFHVGYQPGLHFGSALQGCSAFAGTDHWFYVTYGLTELWRKESDDPTLSGFGYELTIRVRRQPQDDEPPQWPFGALHLMAEYVRGGPQPLWLGDRVRLATPLSGDPEGALFTAAVCVDPVLETLETPNGRVAFWQIVGLTDAEVQAARESSTDEVLDRLRQHQDPLLIIDPGRR